MFLQGSSPIAAIEADTGHLNDTSRHAVMETFGFKNINLRKIVWDEGWLSFGS